MIVDCAVYEGGRRRAGDLPLEDAFEAGRDDDAFVWIGLHEPSSEEFEAVRLEFGLHELAVEDAIKAHQRPKLEIYGDTLFVVLKPVAYDDDREEIELGETLLFVGEGFILSVRHGEATALAEVRRAVEADPDRLRCGPPRRRPPRHLRPRRRRLHAGRPKPRGRHRGGRSRRLLARPLEPGRADLQAQA